MSEQILDIRRASKRSQDQAKRHERERQKLKRLQVPPPLPTPQLNLGEDNSKVWRYLIIISEKVTS